MSKLEELISELCPDGVEYKKLEECCTVLDRQRKPVTKAAREAGEYPYYGANGIQDYVSDYIFDGTFVLVGEDGSVITPEGTPVVNWAEGKIWVNNHAHIIEEKKGVLLRYLYHYLQTVDVTPLIHGNIPKLTGGDFKAIAVPVPPLEVQSEIVRVLDCFTLLTAELTAELTARQKQYEYYRNKMLMEVDAPIKKLIEITHSISSGKNKERLNDGAYPVYGSTGIISTTNTPAYEGRKILVARVGANAGYVHIADGKYDVSDNTLMINLKENVLLEYLFYHLENMNLNQYAKGGGQPLITGGQLKDLEIPVPSLDEQKRIVDILDKFHDLTNSITSGIPAEIEAREKQYNYYREKILKFDKGGE